MGTDNLHHQRRAKKARDLNRRASKRSSYEKVLIVCEGEKTEPNYFNEIVDYYQINTANIEIDGTSGSSPTSVFERALELYAKEKAKGDSFDRVYCVFDKDSHESYPRTVGAIKSQRPAGTFYVATSVPCFEYWLILHYQYTTRPYSTSVDAYNDLRALMPDYQKGSTNLFSKLIDQLEFAKANAIRANAQANENFTDNPTTQIHELVEYLQNIKSQ